MVERRDLRPLPWCHFLAADNPPGTFGRCGSMENKMTRERRGRAVVIVGTVGGFLVGCVEPNLNTVASRSDMAGRQCAFCMATDPADYWACQATCVQRVEDEEAYLKAIGR
jgi:hypothetical protein